MWGFIAILMILGIALFFLRQWLYDTGRTMRAEVRLMFFFFFFFFFCQGCVFVTGCDSGMGLETTTYLSGKGFHVFAACLTEDGKKDLSSNANVTPLVLDVTREEEVAKAAEFVEKTIAEKKLGGLFGVLQCAGLFFFSFCSSFCFFFFQ